MDYSLGEKLTVLSSSMSSGSWLYSTWKEVTSRIPQGFILALVLFNVSINDMEEKTAYTLKKSADDPKLGAVNALAGRAAIQRDLDRPQE